LYYLTIPDYITGEPQTIKFAIALARLVIEAETGLFTKILDAQS